jgi:hypothetical protein
MEFRLLRPEEVVVHWEEIAPLLDKAISYGNGELEVTDIRKLVLGGRMFVFAGFNAEKRVKLAVTAEFNIYPRKMILVVGFGAGVIGDQANEIFMTVADFARKGGATAIQTFCKNPAMVRLHQKYYDPDVAYTVLEKQL